MRRMGITPEDLEGINSEMMQAFGGAEELDEMDEGDEGDDEESGKTENYVLFDSRSNIADSYRSGVYNGSKYTGGKVYKTADITIRIPESKLDLFVEEIGDFSNVVEKTVNTEDVTLQYVDTEGKKAMYRAEEESLLALLENAEDLDTIRELEIIRQTLIAAEKMKQNGDCIAEDELVGTVAITLSGGCNGKHN